MADLEAMTDVVKRHRHEIDRLADSRRVLIVAVGCWVGERLPNPGGSFQANRGRQRQRLGRLMVGPFQVAVPDAH